MDIISSWFISQKHTDFQQALEKIYNIAIYQRNPSYNEMSPHVYQNGYHEKDNKEQILAKK